MKARNHLKYLLVIASALSVIMVAGACSAPTSAIGNDKLTEEQALQKAEDYIQNSPTYIFDGIDGTLELEEILYPDIEGAWQFVFCFDSSHAGYGDRNGEMLAQVITDHQAVITIEKGEVIAAIIDGEWDMVEQDILG